MRKTRIVRIGRARAGRWLAAAAVLASLPLLTAMNVPMGDGAPLIPQRGAPAVPRRVSAGKAVPVYAVPSRHVKPFRAPVSWRPAPPRWPAAGSATVGLKPVPAQATAAAGRASLAAGLARPAEGSVQAGKLPVWVGPARTGASVPSEVTVAMQPRSDAVAAAVSGVIFTVRAPGAEASSRLHVTLDYSSFAEANGGSFGSRLRLVELPQCALTTPQLGRCRVQTPLGSANNSVTDQLGADLSVPAGTAVGAAGSSGLAADAASGRATSGILVLAASTDTSGSQGNYSATPLTDTGSWTAGGSSGAFNFSYPITTPPVPGGLTPPVALNYDSQEVDGLTSATNDQASWIGDGWAYDPGFVERDYETCSQDNLTPALSSAQKTGDLCWSANNQTTLSLNGTTTTLVDDPKNGWTEEADGGAQVTYKTGTSTSNGTKDGGYWVVTEPDGTSYYFGMNELPGWESGYTTTNSAWTEPVYSPRSTDTDESACYTPTFSGATPCQQAWRWNLDYVTDSNGNAMAYFYNTQTNYYGADNATTGTQPYTQAGALATIWYGFRAGDIYSGSKGAPAGAGEVKFGTVTTRTDVPTDLTCTKGGKCSVNSPSFWSPYQLTSISTYGLDGSSMKEADTWALSQSFVNPGDNTTTAPLLLNSIKRTGEDGTALNPPMPPVTFGYQPLVNRVETSQDLTDGYTQIPRERIDTVTSETGEITSVTYDSPPSSCTSGNFPAEDDNTTLCYPEWWTPPEASSPIEDWFNMYVVTAVQETNTAGGGPAMITSYCYGTAPGGGCLSGGSWHYNDNSLTRSAQRTWNQWHGFDEVTTETGTAPDPVSESVDYYFQGMNGDEQSGGGTSSASLSATIPGTSTTITATDEEQWDGDDFEHIVYDGAGGAVVSDTVTTPWTSAATATQSQPGTLPDLYAYLTGTAETQTFTALASGGYRQADVTYTHDSLGRVITQAVVPDTSNSSEDTCTQTTYASDSSVFLTDLPSRVTVTTASGSACPVTLPATESELISDTETVYDGQALGTATAGNATEVEKVTSYTGSTPNFTMSSETAYDEYGRVTSSTDADGHATTTAYTPLTGAEPTSETVTTPATANAPNGLATTTAYDPLRELPITVTDPDGEVTSETYDALGWLTDVWTPGHPEATAPADFEFSYDVSPTAASVITTDTITSTGTYNVSEDLYDSMLRQIETQTATPSGGRDITDQFYNSDGEVYLKSNSYYATGAPSATLVEAAANEVPSQTGYVFDGAGRQIKQIAYTDGSETWESDTTYGGDYTTVTPPAGGTAETTYTNGDGLTSYIYQYHSSPPPASPPAPGTASEAGSSGWDETAYTYTSATAAGGEQDGITDSAGNQWTYSYDLNGNQISAKTPNTGLTTSTYDPDGNLTSTTDADGNTVSYLYDADGRKTAEFAATTANQSASNQIAAWTYDTLALGQTTSSTSYTSGSASGEPSYTKQALGYDSDGQPTGQETIISTGPLAGTYKRTYAYNAYTDEMSSYYDYAAGGLPAEQVNTSYDTSGNPTGMSSSLWTYVASLSYTDIGQPLEYTLGTTTEPAWVLDTYDPETGHLDTQVTQAGSTPVTVDDQSYSYDDNGDITAEADTSADATAQDQCYQYNYLDQLTDAWAQSSTPCASAPSDSVLGGANAYWEQMTYSPTGNMLTNDTTYGATGSQSTVDLTNTYPAAGSAGPNQLTSQAVASSVFGSWTNTQTYNGDGELTASDNASSGDATYNWGGTDRNPGELTSVTNGSNSTSYIYDADGTLLLQTDNGVTTLYLPDEEIVSASGTLSGTRYYSVGGVTIAARSSSGDVQYLIGNQQGTDSVAIDASDLAVTQRYYNPWGGTLGFSPPPFPGDKGFVGGTTDATTGLTDLGAREYNPANSQFISPDPVLNPQDPQDLNPYSYAADNPATEDDPTGLMMCMAGGPCGSEQWLEDYANQQQHQAEQQYTSFVNNIENQQLESCDCHPATMEAIVKEYKNPAFDLQKVEDYIATASYDQNMLVAAQAAQQRQQQSCSNWFSCAWHKAAGWVDQHRVVIGIGLGILAIATGGAGLVLGTAALAADATVSSTLLTGLAFTAVGSGFGAAAADEPDCARGNQTACFGRDMGFTGAAMGLPAAGVGTATFFGAAIAETSGVNIAALALGAGGFQFGTFGTVSDITSALTHDGNG
jgi:RHS repeat-associated protein